MLISKICVLLKMKKPKICTNQKFSPFYFFLDVYMWNDHLILSTIWNTINVGNFFLMLHGCIQTFHVNFFLSFFYINTIYSQKMKLFLLFLGLCSIILCHFILPWRINWAEVSFFNFYLLNTEMFWKVMQLLIFF